MLVSKGPQFFVALSAHQSREGAQAAAQQQTSLELRWECRQVRGEHTQAAWWEARTGSLDRLFQVYPLEVQA